MVHSRLWLAHWGTQALWWAFLADPNYFCYSTKWTRAFSSINFFTKFNLSGGVLRSATFCAVCYFPFALFFHCSYAYPLRYRFPWILLAIVAVNHPQSTMTTCYSCQSRSRPRGLKGECPREEGGVTLWIAIVCTRGMCVCCARACVLCSWFRLC